jgi:hypothetical protein
MRRVLILAALALAAGAAPATAQSGSIVATIAWNTVKGDIAAKGITMTVFDGDTQIVDATVPDNQYYTPTEVKTFGNKPVGVEDFDGDGTPEVIFNFFSGGAHCCVVTYLYDGSTLLKHDFGNVGYTLRDDDGDGVSEFNTEDDNFSGGFFASYAGSIRPTRILQYRDGAFDDSFTRDPSVKPKLEKELRRYTRYYEKAVREVGNGNDVWEEIIRSSLAAITAEDCLLGDCAPGYAKVDDALAKSLVRKSYVRLLHRKLVKWGYDSGDGSTYGGGYSG